MLACCKNCARGQKAQHSACNAQCAAGQAASINDSCTLYSCIIYTTQVYVIIMFMEI